jgi:hypothetical protein
MLKKTKLALIGALVLGSTAIASAQNATDRPDTGYFQPQQQNDVQGNPNKNVGEDGGGGA